VSRTRSIIKNFYANRPSKYSFVAVFLLFWFVVSIVILIVNRGIYFASFHSNELMKVTTDGSRDVISRFSTSPYVAAIDHENSIVEFQSIPNDEFNKIVADLQVESGVVSVEAISQNPILPQDVVMRFVWTAVAALLIVAVFIYVTVLRKLMVVNRNLTWRIAGFYLVAMGIGLVNIFGIISLFSRFYQLTDVSIAALGVTFLWGASSVFLVLYETWEHHTNFYSNMLDVFTLNRRRLLWLTKISAIIWGIILIAVMIGLGQRFIIDGLLIGAGVIIIGASLMVLPTFILRLNVVNVKAYSQMFQSYNSQTKPIYQRQVIAESKVKKSNLKSKSKGSKANKPKRRQ